jgi:hypothetical protein
MYVCAYMCTCRYVLLLLVFFYFTRSVHRHAQNTAANVNIWIFLFLVLPDSSIRLQFPALFQFFWSASSSARHCWHIFIIAGKLLFISIKWTILTCSDISWKFFFSKWGYIMFFSLFSCYFFVFSNDCLSGHATTPVLNSNNSCSAFFIFLLPYT